MKQKSILLSGNEAVVYGALRAGCGAFFGYPITPAGEIIEAAAVEFPRAGKTFLQAESEIGAINMVMGSASAGERAMTASSGLGISLMQEAVSYLAGMELPCLIVDITRSGPGLGNIAVEQADYNQVVKGGGHGGYHCVVLAPASAQEMYEMSALSFELAETYRTPVYIMTDSIIGQMIETVNLIDSPPMAPVVRPALGAGYDRSNYFTSIYLDPEDLRNHSRKLQEKYNQIRAKEQRSESYRCDGARVILVAYGISSRLAKRVVDLLRERNIAAGLLRPVTLFPFPVDELNQLADQADCFISLELSDGQMIDDVSLAIRCRRPVHLIHEMGGVLFTEEQIMKQVCEYYARTNSL